MFQTYFFVFHFYHIHITIAFHYNILLYLPLQYLVILHTQAFHILPCLTLIIVYSNWHHPLDLFNIMKSVLNVVKYYLFQKTFFILSLDNSVQGCSKQQIIIFNTPLSHSTQTQSPHEPAD